MKDETLQELDQLIPVGATIAALAIKPDDSSIKAWLGEPVAWLGFEYCVGHKHAPDDTPLYSPKGLK